MVINVSAFDYSYDTSIVFEQNDFVNLDCVIASILHPILVAYRSNIKNPPHYLTGGIPSELTEEEYISILDKMIFSFDAVRKMGVSATDYQIVTEAHSEKIQAGLMLFGKYLRHFWD